MKAFVLIRMRGGRPDIDFEQTPIPGYVLADQIRNTGWGAYLVSGTGVQLLALDALPQVVGIVAVTEDGNVKWGELENPVDANVRQKLNTWLSSQSHPTIPDGWSNRRVVREIYERANAHFDLDQFDIAEVA